MDQDEGYSTLSICGKSSKATKEPTLDDFHVSDSSTTWELLPAGVAAMRKWEIWSEPMGIAGEAPRTVYLCNRKRVLTN